VYALPHLAWIFHLVALSVWAETSPAKFETGDCKNELGDTDSDEAYDVCISAGPVVAII